MLSIGLIPEANSDLHKTGLPSWPRIRHAALVFATSVVLGGCETTTIDPRMHAFPHYDFYRDYSTEDVSHHYLHPQRNISYNSVEETLNGREPILLVLPDITPRQPVFDSWPRPWTPRWYYHPTSVTDVALAEDGAILLFDRLSAGRLWQPEEPETNQVSEIVAILTTHPLYRLVLERVNALLPGIQPGRGFVRLDFPLEASWPFFDYDVARLFNDFGSARLSEEFAGGRGNRVLFDITRLDDDLLPQPSGDPSFLPRYFALAYDGALLFVEDRPDHQGQREQGESAGPTRIPIWRMQQSHPQFPAVRAELLRVFPELERGSGFVQLETEFAGPGWPFIPLAEAMDGMIDRQAAAGEWYQPLSAGPNLSIPAPPAEASN